MKRKDMKKAFRVERKFKGDETYFSKFFSCASNLGLSLGRKSVYGDEDVVVEYDLVEVKRTPINEYISEMNKRREKKYKL